MPRDIESRFLELFPKSSDDDALDTWKQAYGSPLSKPHLLKEGLSIKTFVGRINSNRASELPRQKVLFCCTRPRREVSGETYHDGVAVTSLSGTRFIQGNDD